MGFRATATEKGPLVVIVALILFAFTLTASAVRGVVKLNRGIPPFKLEDALQITAVVLGAIQTTTTVLAAYKGVHEVDTVVSGTALKLQLSGSVFYVNAVGLAAASHLRLVFCLTPVEKQQQATLGLSAFVAIWTLISTIVVIFQCGVPLVTNSTGGSCIDQAAWWSVYDVVNIMIQINLMIFPVYFIWKLQWPRNRKFWFSTPFAFRLTAVAAYLIDIALWNTTWRKSSNVLVGWKTTITAQVVQCCCLSAIAVLYYRSFLEMARTGYGLDEDFSTMAEVELRTINISSQSQERLTRATVQPNKKFVRNLVQDAAF